MNRVTAAVTSAAASCFVSISIICAAIMEVAVAALVAVPPVAYYAAQRSRNAVAESWSRIGDLIKVVESLGHF